MLFQEQIKMVKQAAPELAATTNEQRNAALAAVRTALQQHQEEIFEANRQDMEQAEADGVSGPVRKRLKFDEGKLRDVMAGISDLTGMEDPLFQTQFARELDEGLVLKRVTCPIGVIGVIFEARPDALVQISALCIKSGNCAILKGGSEALRTNRTLFDIIHRAVINAGLPADCMMQLEARSEINELLECHDSVDLLIPRGSNVFVQYIMILYSVARSRQMAFVIFMWIRRRIWRKQFRSLWMPRRSMCLPAIPWRQFSFTRMSGSSCCQC